MMLVTSKGQSWSGPSIGFLLVLMLAGLAGCGVSSSAGQTQPAAAYCARHRHCNPSRWTCGHRLDR